MRKNRRPVTSSGRVGLLVAAAAVAGGGVVARGQTVVTWVGTTGNYVDGVNWSSGVTPANASNEYLQINNGGTAQVSSDAQGAFLHLGYQPGDVGSLQLTGGTLTVGELRVGGRETIPDPANPGQFIGNGGGSGTVVQGGTSTLSVTYATSPGAEPPVQSLYVGDSGLASGNTANGSYTIKDSAYLLNGVAINDQLVVGTGPGAHGTFTQQDASTVVSTGTFVIGRRGATGSYTLSGGTMSSTTTQTSTLIIGDGETTDGATAGTSGLFTQTGGAVSITTAMELGRRGGTGTYVMSGGTLKTGQFNVGTTSSSTAAGTTTPVGTFSLSGTGSVSTSAGANVFIGFNGASSSYSPTLTGAGNFNMSGGTMTLYSTLFILGSGAGATGTASVSGGTLQGNTGINVEVDIGRNSGAGTFNLSDAGNVKVANFFIGGNAANIGTDATFNMSGGTLTATTALVLSATARTDANATRTFNMTGGSVTAGTFNQNTTNPGSAVTRIANISGGTFTVTGNTTGGFGVVYNLTGGTQNFQGNFTTNASSLNIGGTANVSINSLNPSGTQGGTITVSGGTLTCPDLHVGFNSAVTPATFTQTGGTLNATTFTSGGTATKVNLSGGTINIGSLILSTGTVVTTDNNLSLASAITLGSTAAAGSTTFNVNSGSLTLSGPVGLFAGNPSFTLNKTGAGTLTLAGTHNHTAAATITASAGTLNLNADVGPNTTVNASGAATTFNASQTLTALNVSDGVTAALAASGSRSLSTGALNLNSTGTLDLTNNSLSVPTASLPAATLRSYLASAYNGGTWNGASGLTSTTAKNRADHATGLGYYDNGTQTLVKYTWMGDLNLDGRINGDDYALIDRGFALHLTSWVNGDVNYDGSVTVADYAVMDAAFGHQSGGLSPEFLAAREAQFGEAYVAQLTAAVPEPGTLSLLAAAALPLVARRRRQS